MEDAIVLYPSPGIGHLISMVELGKLVLTHYPSAFSIHILIVPQPYNSAGSTAPYIDHVSSTVQQITFHHLSPPPPTSTSSSPHRETLTFEILHRSNSSLHQILTSISSAFKIYSLVIDFFCTPALSVSSKLKIPTFYFFTSGAACLASFLFLPTLHNSTEASFKDMVNTHLEIPGLPLIPANDMPKPILDRHDKAYDFFLDMSMGLVKSDGVIVNSFEMLEEKAIKAVRDGRCVPGKSPTPKLCCIGPLISEGYHKSDTVSRNNETLKWLDTQPSKSVVFLCFGSRGLFSRKQLIEIAIGLERSGSRFVWVVRNPPKNDNQENQHLAPTSDLDLDDLLPRGFLERTKDRGLIVKQWAPQVAVLSHDSIGGFVTHCGWNSVLEAVCGGVPMIAWPLYAEQRFNKNIMVAIKIALAVEEADDGFVNADELVKRLNELMDSGRGELVRKQVMAIRDGAKQALSEGGSSRVALDDLVNSWKAGL